MIMNATPYYQPTEFNTQYVEAFGQLQSQGRPSFDLGSDTKGARTTFTLQIGTHTSVFMSSIGATHLKYKLNSKFKDTLSALSKFLEECQQGLESGHPVVDEMGDEISDPVVQYEILEARLTDFVDSYLHSTVARKLSVPVFGVGPDFQVYVTWVIKSGERTTLFITGASNESPYFQLQLNGKEPEVSDINLSPSLFPRLLEDALQKLHQRSLHTLGAGV